jgi:hypothetical protein
LVAGRRFVPDGSAFLEFANFVERAAQDEVRRSRMAERAIGRPWGLGAGLAFLLISQAGPRGKKVAFPYFRERAGKPYL